MLLSILCYGFYHQLTMYSSFPHGTYNCITLLSSLLIANINNDRIDCDSEPSGIKSSYIDSKTPIHKSITL